MARNPSTTLSREEATPQQTVYDLGDRTQIAEMVRRFYADVAQDDLLGQLFNDVARVDWADHLTKLTAYWCHNLLGTPGYRGNSFRAHLAVHARSPFTAAHFDRWLELFEETLDTGWRGPQVERARAFARKVAQVQRRRLLATSASTAGPEARS